VITNIDREHLDHYRDLEQIRQAYIEFANKVPFYGVAVVCADDANIQAILPLITRRVIRYGTSDKGGDAGRDTGGVAGRDASGAAASAGFDLTATEISHDGFRSRFRLAGLGEFTLGVPGRHNVLNAMAAIAVGLQLDAPLESIRAALAAYGGVDRRFQVRGVVRGVTVIDDYGHHPTEIIATLAAARSVVANGGRVLVAFQPHRYSRTCLLLDEFSRAFSDADHVWITAIYPAGEAPIEGVSGESLANAVQAAGHPSVRYTTGFEQLVEELAAQAREGDLVIALGAGHINQICEKMIWRLS
jgi:UDP-N-acetylmuramate--alanine ligase